MHAAQDMPSLAGLRPFDSCMTLTSTFPWHHDAAGLLAIMDRYRMVEALVQDNHARLVHPREHANRRLVEAIRGHPRLHAVWVIEPPKIPGPAAARAVVHDMLAAGVRTARFPLAQTPPLPWLWRDLCAALEEHRVPCFLDFGGVRTSGNPDDAAMNGIRDLALSHPNLPLVFSHIMGGLGIHRAIPHLLRRTENTYLDTTGILEYWREAVADIGPERVLFATGTPFTDAGILISNVQYARDLNERAKQLICGDNLRRLLGAVR